MSRKVLPSKLNTVTSPWLLQSVDYDIANILDSDGEIVSTTGMPMTGVIRDISVASDESQGGKDGCRACCGSALISFLKLQMVEL